MDQHFESGTKVKILDCNYPDLIGTMGIIERHIYSDLPVVKVESVYRGNRVSYVISAKVSL